MIATVKAYYNTGLTVGNCLDNISQLDALGFSSHSFPNIAIKQDRGRISIRINTDYSTIKDADYVKINDVGYWVTGITMLNDNVAEVGLQQDFVTTAGVFNLDIVSGWCTRRHVTTDTLYENTLDEPFSPTSPLKIDFGKELKGSGSSDVPQTIIVSSIDLANLPLTAKAYVDAASDKVLVPDLNVVPNGSLNTLYTSHVTGAAKSTRMPATQAYNGATQTILDALSQVRSLGVESCIVACYTVNANWVALTESNGKITSLEDYSNDETSGLTQIPGTFKNNKVYSGQFNRVINYSLASGEASDNRVEDIQNNGVIVWRLAADPRYNGHPVCMPKYVHGTENNKLLSAINGAQWQNIPITYQGASGAGFMGNALKTGVDKLDNQRMYSIMGGMAGLLSMSGDPYSMYHANGGQVSYSPTIGNTDGMYYMPSAGGIAGGANPYGVNPFNMAGKTLGGVAALGALNANTMYSKQALFNSYNQAMATVDVQFPRIPSFQDYIGNTFFEMRYRLSDNDMVRFDNFLTQFGYAVDEVLEQSCFAGRTHFNYVQGRDVSIKKSGVPQYILEGMAKSIESGVRIWHTAPAHSKLLDNPIA